MNASTQSEVQRFLDVASRCLTPPYKQVQDFELTLPVVNQHGDTVSEACGWHWTLYTTKDMPAEQFETLYELFRGQLIPCKVAGRAEACSLLEEDDDFMPADRHAYVSVLAFERLATQTTDPNTRLFSELFSDHLRAQDMEFKELAQCLPIASLLTTAFDLWKAIDPELYSAALQAQDLLGKVVEYQPLRPTYKPYWVST